MRSKPKRLSTGISGLDEILYGGFIERKTYLLYGDPGTGKSMIGYHYLEEGVKNNEDVLLITLGETKQSILENAASVNIDLSSVSILDLSPDEQVYENAESYSLFSASEVETPDILKTISDKVEKLKPDRILLDSISMLKLLFSDSYQYRKMALAFIKYIRNTGATLLIILESNSERDNIEPFWVDGVIKLSFSYHWRSVEVEKFRGAFNRKGSHALTISNTGVRVFPKLQPNSYEREFKDGQISSDIEELDKLTNGGLEIGTTTMITGPTGVGKTCLGVQFVKAAASRGERSVIYTFEESTDTIKKRSRGINLPIEEMCKDETLKIVPIEPLSYSPDEFASMVRRDVEENGTKMIMIDTISAYTFSVREENPIRRLHSLGVYLQNMGVTVLLINELTSITGDFVASDMNTSYLADNIIYLRYIEVSGELKKAVGVLKKRLSSFEHSIRDFQITSCGIHVGSPLRNMEGILAGSPKQFQEPNTEKLPKS